MPSEDTKILEFNQYQKLTETPFSAFADLKNNLRNSSTRKVSGHILSGFSMSSISSFRSIEHKHDVYRGIECMKKISECLREHPIEIINFKKKKNEVINKRAARIV